MKPLLSIKQASTLTGLAVPTLYKYALLRTVPFVKLGRRLLFDEDRLIAWIDEHRSEPVMESAAVGVHGRRKGRGDVRDIRTPASMDERAETSARRNYGSYGNTEKKAR